MRYYSVIGQIFIVLACSSLFSCNKTQYGPGVLGEESRYLAKPFNTDSSGIAHYVSGSVYVSNKAYEYRESSRIYSGNYHFSLSRKNYSFSVGAGGYTGNYLVKTAFDLNGTKAFWGVSTTSEISYCIPIEALNWKIAGLRYSVFYEDGEFSKFRELAREKYPIDNLSDENFLHNVSYTSEFDINFQTFRFSLYQASGLTTDLRWFFCPTTSIGGSLYYKRFVASFQGNFNQIQGRNFMTGLTFGF
jgi:hypothetical protein